MKWSAFPQTVRGHLLIAAMSAVMALGPIGCNSANLTNPSNAKPDSNPFGLLINTDTSSDVLGGIRLSDGSSVYVYGSFKPDGNVQDVTGAALRDKDGHEASVVFAGVLIKKATSFDGSTITAIYDQADADRLTGHADIFVADSGTTQTFPFDVDLHQAAADLAQQVEQLTGIPVSSEPPPPNPAGREKTADGSKPATAKAGDNAQLILLCFPCYQFAFASLGFLCMQLMTKLIAAMVATMVQTVVLTMMTPFIILGDVMRAATTQPIVTLRFVDLNPLIIIPSRPRL